MIEAFFNRPAFFGDERMSDGHGHIPRSDFE